MAVQIIFTKHSTSVWVRFTCVRVLFESESSTPPCLCECVCVRTCVNSVCLCVLRGCACVYRSSLVVAVYMDIFVRQREFVTLLSKFPSLIRI